MQGEIWTGPRSATAYSHVWKQQICAKTLESAADPRGQSVLRYDRIWRTIGNVTYFIRLNSPYNFSMPYHFRFLVDSLKAIMDNLICMHARECVCVCASVCAFRSLKYILFIQIQCILWQRSTKVIRIRKQFKSMFLFLWQILCKTFDKIINSIMIGQIIDYYLSLMSYREIFGLKSHHCSLTENIQNRHSRQSLNKRVLLKIYYQRSVASIVSLEKIALM